MLLNRPQFILGTVQLGMNYGIQNQNKTKTAEMEERLAILDRAQQLGIATLDTANDYGEAQEVIRQYKKKQHFKILGKFRLTEEQPHVEAHLEKTLAALDALKIEAYSYHHADDIKKYPKSLNELMALKKKGVIQQIGVSVYTNDQLVQATKHSEIDLIQVPFNILDNFPRRGSYLKKAVQAGKSLHVRSAFLQGLLLMSPEQLPARLQSVAPILRRLTEMAKEMKTSPEQLCLAYILQQNLFTGLVIGVDNKDQLVRNWQNYQSASRLEIDIKEIEKLEVKDERILDPSQWQNL